MTTVLKKLIKIFILFFLAKNSYAFHPLIIDTDVGVDDVVAMLYLFQLPNVNIKAISIESDGNAHCKPALRNTLGLLTLTHYKTVPVACGRETPLAYGHHFTKAVLYESDTLVDTAKLLPKTKSIYSGNAVKLILATLEHNQSVDILAIGPLTNLAEALTKKPEIKNKIHQIYIMGGAVHVKGNVAEVDPTTQNEAAEWNIYLDPKAADIVFHSGVPITLIPLDATNQVPIDKNFYSEVKNYKTPSGKYLYELFKHNEPSIENSQWYFWDPLAAVIATDESIATFQNEKLKVILAPDTQSGAIVVDQQNGNWVRVCYGVKKDQFKKTLLRTINFNPVFY